MSLVFLYAGQGSQKVGMGKDFYDNYETFRNFLDKADSEVELDLKQLMFEGPMEELSKTENTQGSMAAFAAGVTMLLEEKGIKPEISLGLSLGEYGALYAAGVFNAIDYVKLTAFRGRVMMEAAQGIECSMSAVLGAESSLVEEECRNYTGEGFITLSNYNCPGQYVICGDEAAVSAVEAALKEKGVRKCVRLKVSGPFHTKYMKPAGDALTEYFSKMEFNEPNIPVLLNVSGDYYKGEDLKEALVEQVQNSIRLEDELKKLLSEGGHTFVEIGPGNVISGFLKKTAKAIGTDVNVMTIDTAEDFEKVIEKLQ